MMKLSIFSRVGLRLMSGLIMGLTGTIGIAAEQFITVASTTSTEASGLFGHILPQFEEKSGIEVRVVAVGTGQAIDIAKRGDADVLFVHHQPSEKRFVEQGQGVKRFEVMYNDFVIVGPREDPAAIRGMENAATALQKIADTQSVFVSRGDDSGTHKKELSLWNATDINAEAASGSWYRETGSGMGATLNMASSLDAYTLADRATWISFQNKGNLAILVQGDPRLFNQYGVILVNPQKHPHIKVRAGQRFIDWLISEEGQQAIASYKLDGKQLFFPNTGKSG